MPVAAGGNVGIIRNVLGDFSDPVEMPRIVAATTPVTNGFPEGLSIDPGTITLYAAFQARDRVFAYNAAAMISRIEAEAKCDPIPSFSQFPEPLPIPHSLSRLLRGPLSSIPTWIPRSTRTM